MASCCLEISWCILSRLDLGTYLVDTLASELFAVIRFERGLVNRLNGIRVTCLGLHDLRYFGVHSVHLSSRLSRRVTRPARGALMLVKRDLREPFHLSLLFRAFMLL